MDKGIRRKVHPFDSFSLVLKVLTVAGYTKLFKPKNRCTEILHKIYRVIVIGLMFTYNVQHIIYTAQMRNDKDKFMEGAMLELPEVVVFVKAIVMYIKTKRLDNINDNIINDPVFAALNEQDEKYLTKNTKFMHFLSKFNIVGLSFAAILWMIEPIFNRMIDETYTIPSYIPFETNTWYRFHLANLLDKCLLLYVGYGSFSIDLLIANYYTQAWVQLKIINYNLERLFHPHQSGVPGRTHGFQYLDVLDKSLHKRFVHYVKRYEKVVMLTNEVTEIFSTPITTQFFISAFTTCLVVIQMSSTESLSISFMFLVMFYVATQFQIIVYCFAGGYVEHESRFVANSVYLGDWHLLSPSFRRLILIAMVRWTVPITPKVLGVIPLSPTTFVALSRSAYTLYTVLKTKNNGERTLAF